MIVILGLLTAIGAGLLLWLIVKITVANHKLGVKWPYRHPLSFALRSMNPDSAMPAKQADADAGDLRPSQETRAPRRSAPAADADAAKPPAA